MDDAAREGKNILAVHRLLASKWLYVDYRAIVGTYFATDEATDTFLRTAETAVVAFHNAVKATAVHRGADRRIRHVENLSEFAHFDEVMDFLRKEPWEHIPK